MSETADEIDTQPLTESDGVTVESDVDVVAISRLERLRELEDVDVLGRMFTEAERNYCESAAHPAEHYAGRWCVKEAVKKILDRPGNVSLREIRVEKDGPVPKLALSENARERLGATIGADLDDDRVDTSVSLSHDRESGIAVGSVVIVRSERQ